MGRIAIAWMISVKVFPPFLGTLANIACFTITLSTISRVTDDQYVIGAIGLGNMTLNMFLRSYVLGFNNSLVTLLSQAYGAGHMEMMGHIINRSKILFTLCSIPIFLILFFIGTMIEKFELEKELVDNTQFYVRIAMFGFIFHLYFDIYRKVLNSMKLYHVYSPVSFITIVLHIFWCYFFIIYLEMGLLGAAIPFFIQSVSNFIIIYFIVHYLGYGVEAIRPFGKEAFEGWGESFSLGIPTFFLQFFAFVSIEIIILLSGVVDIEILVANTALINLFYLLYLYIACVMQSGSAMIGNKIGEGSKIGAQKLIDSVIIFGFTFTTLAISFLFLFKDYIFALYSTKESVIEKMNSIVYMYSIALACYMMKDSFCSVIIGLGLQGKTLTFNLLSYLQIGIPLSCFLTFYCGWTYSGPWTGIAFATFLNAAYYFYLIIGHDLQWFIDEYNRKHEFTNELNDENISKSINSSIDF